MAVANRKTASQYYLVTMLLFCVGIVVAESTGEDIAVAGSTGEGIAVAEGTGEGIAVAEGSDECSNCTDVIEPMWGDARRSVPASLMADVTKLQNRVDDLEKKFKTLKNETRISNIDLNEREDLIITALKRALKGLRKKHALCLDKTTDGHCCALPFKYEGKTYHSCTKEKSTKLWCSITYEHVHKWSYCQGLNGDKRCSFRWGDAIGESEVKVGDQRGVQCIDACIKLKKEQKQHKLINGVKVYADISKGGCWCQKKMTTMDVGNLKYKTCFLVLDDYLRCDGQDTGCCTTTTPCDVGEGDCDSDAECQRGLRCGTDNCPWGDWDDCCVRT